MFSPRRIPAALAAVLLAVACSPEERTSGTPALNEQAFTAGALSGSTFGPAGSPITTNGSEAIVTGIPGEFIRLSYREPDSARLNTYIYFALRTGVQSHIYRIGLNGQALRQLTNDPLGARLPSVSPDGRQVLYFQNLPTQSSTPFYTAVLMEHDGRGKHPVFTEAAVRSPAVWSPAGDTVLVANGDDDPNEQGLYLHPLAAGSLRRRLTSEPDQEPTRGDFGGPQALFVRGDSLWWTSLTDGFTSYYYSMSQINAQIAQPHFSPDATQLLFWLYDPSGLVSLYVVPTSFLSLPRLLLDVDRPIASPFLPYVAWLPDGSGFVISLPSASNPEQYQLYQADTAGHQRLITTLTRPLENGFSVGPAAIGVNRDLLGPAAALGDHASGILFGQSRGHTIASVLALTANDPGTLAMEAETGLNSTAPYLTVSLTADQLTGIRFLNALQGPVTTVVDTTSPGIGGALVTFDASVGTVALVLTYAGGDPPTVRDEGTTRVFSGRFQVVMEAAGHKKSGQAREVRLHGQTGAIEVR